MHLSGQTPLFRAKNLEKHLSIETIYLKLEGSNPTGHKNDRIAEALVKYAVVSGYASLLVHGSDRYIKSIHYFAEGKHLEVYALNMKGHSVKTKQIGSIKWLSLEIPKSESAIEYLEAYAKENHLFFLSEWERKPFIRSLAIQQMMEESLYKVSNPTNVWTQLTGGYTLKSLYHESMRKWVNGNIERVPNFGCGIKSAREIVDEVILEAIETTRTKVIPITDEMAKETVKLIKRLESISISQSEAYALAAFIYAPDKTNGSHIVFLNDGKNDIKIEEISRSPDLNLDEIIDITRKLLEPYNDSIEETSDAIKKAKDVGFIFKATKSDEIQGICIIVHMGFKDFIPSYHLAYIGVKKGNVGRGVATELINQAVEYTGGNMSLHVDIPNKRAKKLYEKMGFVHCYDRMLYKG